MGDRSNLYFKNGDHGVGVYGHWAGQGMAEAAMAVLQNKGFLARLGDSSYATRIGVQTVLDTLGVSAKDETGCGLWTSETGPDDNEYRFLVIDVQSGRVFVTDDWKAPPPSDLIEAPTAEKIAAAMIGN
ncbi:MAG: hypothetical protein U1E65_30420 [Myxococcota bacterium]